MYLLMLFLPNVEDELLVQRDLLVLGFKVTKQNKKKRPKRDKKNHKGVHGYKKLIA